MAYQELTELENKNLPSAERLPSVTLKHLWANARRYNAWATRWMQEQGAHEAPRAFEDALFILLKVENVLARAFRRAMSVRSRS